MLYNRRTTCLFFPTYLSAGICKDFSNLHRQAHKPSPQNIQGCIAFVYSFFLCENSVLWSLHPSMSHPWPGFFLKLFSPQLSGEKGAFLDEFYTFCALQQQLLKLSQHMFSWTGHRSLPFVLVPQDSKTCSLHVEASTTHQPTIVLSIVVHHLGDDMNCADFQPNKLLTSSKFPFRQKKKKYRIPEMKHRNLWPWFRKPERKEPRTCHTPYSPTLGSAQCSILDLPL